MAIQVRTSHESDFDAVAGLIFESTNAWYESHGHGKIFSGSPADCRLFCDVYEDLDPGGCLVAVETSTQNIVGSCFVHPRETHMSLGIMNASPAAAGLGVAKSLLREIIRMAEEAKKPLRLFSSAFNLDSYSLYTRHGFAPYAVFQDMIFQVPEEGVTSDVISTDGVRPASLDDLDHIVALEQKIWGCSRRGDWEYFIRNERGIWHVSVIESAKGEITGVLASVNHPGSNMLGPGIAVDSDAAASLVLAELNVHRGRSPVFLVPAADKKLVALMYGLGARNCELHVGQSLGPAPDIRGVVMPTFMPETG
ncbi:GNAT family N-acetyltransferase [Calycomorphotria hydatis]|uniref:N-acetyltransferase domain-containing protein n=1 Tax=Calycomorphotria hydatis TaxID=2528027 RepID=A0A517T6R0_9PLAN|nr:GNAT family N-acetyltransferase [Calycomorphotria hydatis]QDT64050.1 hypothetical protein V22_12800 [Calycomorphotria hydatis]